MMLDTGVIWMWLHLMGVILWAGGFFYILVALTPALKAGRATAERVEIMQKASLKIVTKT